MKWPWSKEKQEEVDKRLKIEDQKRAIQRDPWDQRYDLFVDELNRRYNLKSEDKEFSAFFTNKSYADSKINGKVKEDMMERIERDIFEGKYLHIITANGEVGRYANKHSITEEEAIINAVKLIQTKNDQTYSDGKGGKRPYFRYQGLNNIRDHPEVFLEVSKAIYRVETSDEKTTQYIPLDQIDLSPKNTVITDNPEVPEFWTEG